MDIERKTCFQLLLRFDEVCKFATVEGNRLDKASRSELRRWFKQSCVEVNFEAVQADDPWPRIVKSLVLFPKNKRKRTTLVFDTSYSLLQLPEPELHLK